MVCFFVISGYDAALFRPSSTSWRPTAFSCPRYRQRAAYDPGYDRDHWTATLEWELPELRYRYILTHGGEVAEQPLRCITFHKDEQELTIRDEWRQPGRVADCLMKAPFRDVYFHHAASQVARGASHYFQVSAPLLESGRELWLTGNVDALGNWNAASAVKMQAREDGRFAANVNIPPGLAVEYKYLLDGVEYEAGENRSFLAAGACLADDGYARFNHPLWKGAGVAAPVFSLRSEKGLGCGEFSDLRLLADWAASTGQRMIQLLPVNDTIAEHSWEDSYPYACYFSVCASSHVHTPARARHCRRLRGHAGNAQRLARYGLYGNGHV